MDISWGELNNNILKIAKEKHIPLLGAFELTSRCNLACKMCYINLSASDQEVENKELTANQWIELAREARDEGMLYLTLTGGEVFLRPDLELICTELSKLGLIISIATNATLIKSESIKWIRSIPLLTFSVSIYGASEESYYHLCGKENVFDTTMKTLELFMQNSIPFKVKTVAAKSNKAELTKIFDLLNKRKIPMGLVDYLAPRFSESSCVNSCERMDPKELIDSENVLSEHIKKSLLNQQSARLNKEMQKTFKEDCITDRNSESINKDYAFEKCLSGYCAFWIHHNGNMVPCGLMDSPFTKPVVLGFKKAWKDLLSDCMNIPICKECKQCKNREFCLTCPARLKSETGLFNKPAKYLCDLALIRKSTAKEA
ncbi:MAG TPA: radical SAM protein [Caldisericia bacterium]|nr:radical SAM protein [Caldisericia bacterium]